MKDYSFLLAPLPRGRRTVEEGEDCGPLLTGAVLCMALEKEEPWSNAWGRAGTRGVQWVGRGGGPLMEWEGGGPLME